MKAWLGRPVTVLVELAPWSFVKRRADGSADMRSPVPCPWAYGALPEVAGGDGDPLDAIVLDGQPQRGEQVATVVQGVVRFVDAGREDDKLVCARQPLSRRQQRAVVVFLRCYAVAKRAVYRWRGTTGRTAVTDAAWVQPT